MITFRDYLWLKGHPKIGLRELLKEPFYLQPVSSRWK
jgi:hypothetical protein